LTAVYAFIYVIKGYIRAVVPTYTGPCSHLSLGWKVLTTAAAAAADAELKPSYEHHFQSDNAVAPRPTLQ